jgi:hypothetical protein
MPNPSGTSTKTTENILRDVYDFPTKSLQILPAGGTLVPDKYDDIVLTYVPSGNGVGQIQTVTYKLSGGTIATLTLTYDSSNRLIEVMRS